MDIALNVSAVANAIPIIIFRSITACPSHRTGTFRAPVRAEHRSGRRQVSTACSRNRNLNSAGRPQIAVTVKGSGSGAEAAARRT